MTIHSENALVPILSQYNVSEKANIISLGNGLINETWKVEDPSGRNYVLQKINQRVFKSPESIGRNLQVLSEYLTENHSDYLFTHPIPTNLGKNYSRNKSGDFFRLFSFITESHSIEVASHPTLAFKAAKAFGQFSRLLSKINPEEIEITLRNFHNLTFRYEEFFWALKRATEERKEMAKAAIGFLTENRSIALEYEIIRKDPDFKLRIMHHDTKISNVLFNQYAEVLCVIDLDTVMPGFFISDFGDMIRTYISPVSEEEQDFERIQIRPDYLEAIIEGYLSEMEDELSPVEKKHLWYAGKFMVYMQAMRFTTDFLNQDVYYLTHYPHQNLNRAMNQITLFHRLMENKSLFNNHYPGQM